MMEQAQAGHGHGDIVFIARFDDIVVADRAAGLGDVVDAAAMGPFNVVAKGEEGIAAQGYAVELGDPGFLFFPCERFRFFREQVLPDAVGQDVFVVIGDVASMALSRFGRRTSSRKGRFRTFGFWRSHQISALLPARRVQWTRDCCPAPTPMVMPSLT